jgi:acyl carrier protein
MHSPEEIRQSLLQYLESSVLGERSGVAIDGATPLIADGIIDSMGVLELLAFVEETFGVVVADDEVVGTNLGTLDALVRFIGDKQRHAAVPEAW